MLYINIAVCENNSIDARIINRCLQQHLYKNGYICNLQTFTSGESLLKIFTPGMFDAIFMDIYMDGMNGIETSKKLREKDPNFALIFITLSQTHAREAYSLRACAYVSKPVQESEMAIAFEQCRTVFLKSARFIEVISDRQPIKIPNVKIQYVEVFDKNVLFHTTTGIIKAYLTLDEVAYKLGEPFLRCHRSYLINLNHVISIQEHDILMRNGDTVPMRQRGRTDIRKAYGNFLTKRLFEEI